MKRDLDLVRSILLWMDAHPHGSFANEHIAIPGHSDEEVGYHIHLMKQAGLVRANDVTYAESRSPQAVPLSVTWEGHEFIDAAKDDTLWNKAKEHVIRPAGGVALSVLVAWLKAEAAARLGLKL